MLHANWVRHRFSDFESGFASAWWVAFSLWHLLAILVLIRRVSGGFVQPLSGEKLLLFVALVIGIASLLRIPARRLDLTRRRGAARWIVLLPTIACLMIVGAISDFASSVFAVVLAWGLVIASEAVWLSTLWSTWRARPLEQRVVSMTQIETSASVAEPASAMDPDTECQEMYGESLPEGVTQQLVRSREEGGESLSGLLRLDFAIGEHIQFVHIPFCPPFAVAPETHVTQVSGADVVAKVAQVETFGVRIEVRRNSMDSERSSVVLEVEATTAIER